MFADIADALECDGDVIVSAGGEERVVEGVRAALVVLIGDGNAGIVWSGDATTAEYRDAASKALVAVKSGAAGVNPVRTMGELS